ncbi:hypothetical protein [Chamaesiphon sp. OTE_75_metabat_556]|nr:hypothetical protein [Chamaesiphon sp. OTE_75_metabat_556]
MNSDGELVANRGSLANFDRAIQLNPNSADADANRGILKADKLQNF